MEKFFGLLPKQSVTLLPRVIGIVGDYPAQVAEVKELHITGFGIGASAKADATSVAAYCFEIFWICVYQHARPPIVSFENIRVAVRSAVAGADLDKIPAGKLTEDSFN
jgi:hypothetical protein